MAKIIKKYILFLALAVSVQFVFAQEEPEIIQITGQVTNTNDGKPVRYAIVVNLNRGTGVNCDSLGFFHFTLIKNDYLRIQSVGYYPMIVNFSDSVPDESKIYKIGLKQRTYLLPEIDIFAARWKDFQFEFANVPIKSDKTKENAQRYILSLVDKQELAMIVASKSVGFQLPYTSNRQKQLSKIAEFEKKDELDKIAEERYNPQLVQRLTGLKGDELDKFIAYCDFDKAYILRSNDYDIVLKINKMFDTYKKSKQTAVDFN